MTFLSFNRRSLAFVLTLVCALFVAASLRPAFGQANPYPPLIDRELFFGDPEISGAQISPDGKFIAFIKPLKGTRNIWVKRTEEPFTAAKPITADTKRPVTQYFWSRDGKYILFVQDKGGDENYLVYAVNPADSPAAGQDVPTARKAASARSEFPHMTCSCVPLMNATTGSCSMVSLIRPCSSLIALLVS